MGVTLNDFQLEAIDNLKNGSILCGGVGSGKSRTAIAYYYFKVCQGNIRLNGKGTFEPMKKPLDLYIITTAKKRDSYEWDKECLKFMVTENPDDTPNGITLVVDSWNNIKKYRKVHGAFFIFDEQRVVGKGEWVKAFLDIARKNKWILLSATPGDTWMDYVPVFIANGFYKNRSEFIKRHCFCNPHTTYFKVERYLEVDHLKRLRDKILVDLDDDRRNHRTWIDEKVGYDRNLFRVVMRDRWDPYDDKPIENISSFYYLLRRVINSSEDRIKAVTILIETISKLIIFYNFDYELEILRDVCERTVTPYSEWNGHRHEPILKDKERWVYLVQYSAGCEGWNCIDTNVIVFYSQTYSYRQFEQAAGRIDRMNSPFDELIYYRIYSFAWVDMAIRDALAKKKNFNERSIGIKWEPLVSSKTK